MYWKFSFSCQWWASETAKLRALDLLSPMDSWCESKYNVKRKKNSGCQLHFTDKIFCILFNGFCVSNINKSTLTCKSLPVAVAQQLDYLRRGLIKNSLSVSFTLEKTQSFVKFLYWCQFLTVYHLELTVTQAIDSSAVLCCPVVLRDEPSDLLRCCWWLCPCFSPEYISFADCVCCHAFAVCVW